MLAILFLAQAAPAPQVIRPAETTQFDLATYAPREGKCSDTYPLGDEVLVCARMADMPKSLEEQAALFEPRPFKPAWKMLGGETAIAVEQRSTIMGSAPAAMATLKLKF